MYQIGERVEIVGGEYAGLGGTVATMYLGGYEVLVGGYRLPVAAGDLAPDLRVVADEALCYLDTLYGHNDDAALDRLVLRLRAALRQ